MNFNNVLKSKYLYYAAVALMVINVLGYVSLGSIECVLVLGGAAYLANQFTKNRTVDIFIGLFVSNILFGCGRLKEGYTEATTSASHKLTTAGVGAVHEGKEDEKKATTPEEQKAAQKKQVAGAQAAGNGQECDKDDKTCKAKKAGKKQGFFN